MTLDYSPWRFVWEMALRQLDREPQVPSLMPVRGDLVEGARVLRKLSLLSWESIKERIADVAIRKDRLDEAPVVGVMSTRPGICSRRVAEELGLRAFPGARRSPYASNNSMAACA